MKSASEKLANALLDPTEWWPPHSMAELVQQAIAEEREACAKWLENEAAVWADDDETPCGTAIWKELLHAAAGIRAQR